MTGHPPLTNTAPAFARELDVAIAAARAGADQICQVYDSPAELTSQAKDDGSPVTVADFASDRAIRAVLAASFPGDALLTEEGADDPARLDASRVWIVDPLDGTQQFIERTGDFDVFVALAVGGVPVVVVSCHPPTGEVLYAVMGHGAWRLPAEGDPRPVRFGHAERPLRLATSPYFGAPAVVPALEEALDPLLDGPIHVIAPGFHPRQFVPAGGDEPLFDIFIAGIYDQWLAGAEWDAIVSDLFVREAGGDFSDLWGEPYIYNKPVARNRYGYVASTDPQAHLAVIGHLRGFRPAARPVIG